MTAPTRACPYCFNQIAEQATRCQHCSGVLAWCKKCKGMMPVTTKRKWVGIARGGTQDQHRCRQCNKVLEGPRL